MAQKTVLKGMTWDHSRGYLPMVATAQRFSEIRPDIEIVWEKRSLKDFEEYPVEALAERYDLIVLDHPFVGYAARHGPLLPLDEYLSDTFLADQERNSVGSSHASYSYDGHQWALAIDAACPVAFWREDLAETLGLEMPGNWEEVLRLAQLGHVEIPAAPINCLMNFYSLCLAVGETPFSSPERVVSRDIGRWALHCLWELLERCAPSCLTRNPIGSHELVASERNHRLVYCPLAYGYSNYARDGYADHRLRFGDAPRVAGEALRTTLGGTGMAVSALRPNRDAALAYAQFAASGRSQLSIGLPAGGQPGHRTAWLDDSANAATNGYFKDTLPTLDRAYLRPRYCGYMHFQEKGGPLLHEALRGRIDDDETLAGLDRLYRESQVSKDEMTSR